MNLLNHFMLRVKPSFTVYKYPSYPTILDVNFIYTVIWY
jgi:hypothetical protein